ncbi:MAG: hypothetical protein OEU36_12850 [Gammaproteobacteria bacterium]|nr:hypothetical protein [Gammaproteobacteria bacterium]
MNEERFVALWRRCMISTRQIDPSDLYQDLVTRYSEPNRRYHNCDHISHCLSQFDLARDLMDNSDAVEMAMWFHDAVYDLHAKDNELQSAELFRNNAVDLINPEFIARVCELVLITRHVDPPGSEDEKYVVDIDLSSFGLPHAEFKRDSDAIRQEYAHIPDKEFYSNRAKFMQSLADQPTLYHTEFFRERYESTAQANLSRALTNLRKAGYL